jgi:hypothetical protein
MTWNRADPVLRGSQFWCFESASNSASTRVGVLSILMAVVLN